MAKKKEQAEVVETAEMKAKFQQIGLQNMD